MGLPSKRPIVYETTRSTRCICLTASNSAQLDFWANELRRFGTFLEKQTGQPLTETALQQEIAISKTAVGLFSATKTALSASTLKAWRMKRWNPIARWQSAI